ncbi:hypothetical protein [Celerinatantimonas sp. YJH-8]|uniref:hypothetical protein n=1 Tax=Celerinatantimonas sp. YJH-8 TaxID=3228714 RepID=UPI0038C1E2F3
MNDYVSVNDVEKFSRLTSSQFFQNAHLVSAGWAFYSNALRVIIGRIEDDGLYRGFAVYEYRGWMGIRRYDAMTIIRDNQASVDEGCPLDLDGIQCKWVPYPYKGQEPPNRYIGYWGHDYYIEDTEPEYWLAYPDFKEVEETTTPNNIDSFSTQLFESLISGELSHPGKLESLYQQNGVKKVYHIEPQSFQVKFSDLGISREALDTLDREVNGESEASAEPLQPEPIAFGNPVNRNHIINQILERLVANHLAATAGKLWLTLQEDIESETFAYDKNEDIRDMDEKALVWIDGYKNERTMSRKTFDNHVSDIRKRLRLKKV